MPKALGEFGKAKHSDISHKIISLVEGEIKIYNFKEIWRHVSSDLEKMPDLSVLLQNLVAADKLQSIPGKGFLAKKAMLLNENSMHLNFDLLTQEEREMSK